MYVHRHGGFLLCDIQISAWTLPYSPHHHIKTHTHSQSPTPLFTETKRIQAQTTTLGHFIKSPQLHKPHPPSQPAPPPLPSLTQLTHLHTKHRRPPQKCLQPTLPPPPPPGPKSSTAPSAPSSGKSNPASPKKRPCRGNSTPRKCSWRASSAELSPSLMPVLVLVPPPHRSVWETMRRPRCRELRRVRRGRRRRRRGMLWLWMWMWMWRPRSTGTGRRGSGTGRRCCCELGFIDLI